MGSNPQMMATTETSRVSLTHPVMPVSLFTAMTIRERSQAPEAYAFLLESTDFREVEAQDQGSGST